MAPPHTLIGWAASLKLGKDATDEAIADATESARQLRIRLTREHVRVTEAVATLHGDVDDLDPDADMADNAHGHNRLSTARVDFLRCAELDVVRTAVVPLLLAHGARHSAYLLPELLKLLAAFTLPVPPGSADAPRQHDALHRIRMAIANDQTFAFIVSTVAPIAQHRLRGPLPKADATLVEVALSLFSNLLKATVSVAEHVVGAMCRTHSIELLLVILQQNHVKIDEAVRDTIDEAAATTADPEAARQAAFEDVKALIGEDAATTVMRSSASAPRFGGSESGSRALRSAETAHMPFPMTPRSGSKEQHEFIMDTTPHKSPARPRAPPSAERKLASPMRPSAISRSPMTALRSNSRVVDGHKPGALLASTQRPAAAVTPGRTEAASSVAPAGHAAMSESPSADIPIFHMDDSDDDAVAAVRPGVYDATVPFDSNTAGPTFATDAATGRLPETHATVATELGISESVPDHVLRREVVALPDTIDSVAATNDDVATPVAQDPSALDDVLVLGSAVPLTAVPPLDATATETQLQLTEATLAQHEEHLAGTTQPKEPSSDDEDAAKTESKASSVALGDDEEDDDDDDEEEDADVEEVASSDDDDEESIASDDPRRMDQAIKNDPVLQKLVAQDAKRARGESVHMLRRWNLVILECTALIFRSAPAATLATLGFDFVGVGEAAKRAISSRLASATEERLKWRDAIKRRQGATTSQALLVHRTTHQDTDGTLHKGIAVVGKASQTLPARNMIEAARAADAQKRQRFRRKLLQPDVVPTTMPLPTQALLTQQYRTFAQFGFSTLSKMLWEQLNERIKELGATIAEEQEMRKNSAVLLDEEGPLIDSLRNVQLGDVLNFASLSTTMLRFARTTIRLQKAVRAGEADGVMDGARQHNPHDTAAATTAHLIESVTMPVMNELLQEKRFYAAFDLLTSFLAGKRLKQLYDINVPIELLGEMARMLVHVIDGDVSQENEVLRTAATSLASKLLFNGGTTSAVLRVAALVPPAGAAVAQIEACLRLLHGVMLLVESAAFDGHITVAKKKRVKRDTGVNVAGDGSGDETDPEADAAEAAAAKDFIVEGSDSDDDNVRDATQAADGDNSQQAKSRSASAGRAASVPKAADDAPPLTSSPGKAAPTSVPVTPTKQVITRPAGDGTAPGSAAAAGASPSNPLEDQDEAWDEADDDGLRDTDAAIDAHQYEAEKTIQVDDYYGTLTAMRHIHVFHHALRLWRSLADDVVEALVFFLQQFFEKRQMRFCFFSVHALIPFSDILHNADDAPADLVAVSRRYVGDFFSLATTVETHLRCVRALFPMASDDYATIAGESHDPVDAAARDAEAERYLAAQELEREQREAQRKRNRREKKARRRRAAEGYDDDAGDDAAGYLITEETRLRGGDAAADADDDGPAQRTRKQGRRGRKNRKQPRPDDSDADSVGERPDGDDAHVTADAMADLLGDDDDADIAAQFEAHTDERRTAIKSAKRSERRTIRRQRPTMTQSDDIAGQMLFGGDGSPNGAGATQDADGGYTQTQVFEDDLGASMGTQQRVETREERRARKEAHKLRKAERALRRMEKEDRKEHRRRRVMVAQSQQDPEVIAMLRDEASAARGSASPGGDAAAARRARDSADSDDDDDDAVLMGGGGGATHDATATDTLASFVATPAVATAATATAESGNAIATANFEA